MNWTREQVLAQAPDDRSVKAAEPLARTGKWRTLAHNERAVWGEIQGSGKDPYRVVIDLAEGVAYNCSCPSPKFPCKHSLALFLLLAGQPGSFDTPEAPAWVSEWLAKRDARSKKQQEKAAAAVVAAEKPAGETAPAQPNKRQLERHARVLAGMDELEKWMGDLMRQGLASTQTGGWNPPAGRMIDAQAPGLARRLNDMNSTPFSGEGWQTRLVEQLGDLQLIISAYRRLDSLPPEIQASVRSQVGFNQTQEEALAQPPFSDTWLALGQSLEFEDQVMVQRTWLWGQKEARPGLILAFSAAGQPFNQPVIPGIEVDAEMVFYPAALPLRLMPKKINETRPLGAFAPCFSIDENLQAWRRALTSEPWLNRFPFCVADARLMPVKDAWFVLDARDQVLPVVRNFAYPWQWLAISGGQSVPVFGEWDGREFMPLSLWWQDHLVIFSRQAGA
ncbi:MAG TPA: SWIM zinc finger family protein [Anaerolineaceae bacterium]|nr:SWIM zinc finger family protein [Anaerolineaceae bacterium]HPN53964.1 SWIM zinc finger family protein [Anaerolineaceae bacterium]